VAVRDTTLGVGVEKTISSVLKVPRKCLLVLLAEVQHIRINSKFNFYGLRGAAFK
jgi:hypothetical protein